MDAGFIIIKYYNFIQFIFYNYYLYYLFIIYNIFIFIIYIDYSYNIYFQALLRHWRRLGLMDAPRSVLSMTMTMALVPFDCFEEALYYIQLEADLTSHEYPAINDFVTYVRKTWLPLASKVSVYNCPARTNNITESFHNIAGRKFGKAHENVWSFLGNVISNTFSVFLYTNSTKYTSIQVNTNNNNVTENLRKLIIDEELKLKRLKTSEIDGHRRSIKNKIRDNKILEIQKLFAAGRLVNIFYTIYLCF